MNRPPATYTQPQLAALYRQMEDHLNRLPGVHGAGLALYNRLLIIGRTHHGCRPPPAKLNEEAGASWDRVSANYLQNLGMPILRGRAFTAADNETTTPVAIVNEAFVKRFFSRAAKTPWISTSDSMCLSMPAPSGSSASCAMPSSRDGDSAGPRVPCSMCR